MVGTPRVTIEAPTVNVEALLAIEGAVQSAGEMADIDLDNIDLAGLSGEAEDQTNEDIERIKRAVANERGCPELLQFEEQLVEDLQEMVTSQVRAAFIQGS